LVATQKYADKAYDLLRAGLNTEPVLDIKEKIQVGATSSHPVSLEDLDGGRSLGGMMLYTSGTTNRPVGIDLSVTFRLNSDGMEELLD
jgi:acyl-coenzyme A synthetase/AMP-(fatty) acid ligase